MVRLPEPLSERILAYGRSLPSDMVMELEKDPHITIKYGLKTTDPDEVAEVLEDVEPFEVVLGRSGVFYGQGHVVLKVEVESKGLHSLNRLVCLRLNHEGVVREYRPHATVAYVKMGDKNPYWWREFYDHSFAGERFGVDQAVMTTPGRNEYVVPLVGNRSRVADRMVGKMSRRSR